MSYRVCRRAYVAVLELSLAEQSARFNEAFGVWSWELKRFRPIADWATRLSPSRTTQPAG